MSVLRKTGNVYFFSEVNYEESKVVSSRVYDGVSGGHGADCVGGGHRPVIHVNSEQTSHPIVVNGGLAEGAKIFVDRDTFFYGDVGAFEGLDYIQTVMNDKTDPDVEYHVVINKPGTLFLFVDNRVGDGNASNPPVLGD